MKQPRPAAPPPDALPQPTMQDVAARAGVSAMTVSRALSGQKVAPDTRERVLAVVRELGYVPDAVAGALSSRRSGFVGFVVPTINNPALAETARGLTDELAKAGLQILLGFSDYAPEREESITRAMLSRRPEAMVLTGSDHTETTRLMLRQAGVPVIEIWEQPEAPLGLAVGFSNIEVGRMIVRHFAARGRRRIAFIGPETEHDVRGLHRLEGYIAEIEALGLGGPRILRHGHPPLTMEQGVEAMTLLLRQWPDTDAVFGVSDLTAFGAIMGCHRLGIAVPGQIAVAGFGDFEVARACFPTITTVAIDPMEIGRLAGERLAAALAGQDVSLKGHLPTPIRLLQRESS